MWVWGGDFKREEVIDIDPDVKRAFNSKRDIVGMGREIREKGGEGKMVGVSVQMEVERLMNLVQGFGWAKEKEEIVGDEIKITLSKKSPAAAAAGPPVGPS